MEKIRKLLVCGKAYSGGDTLFPFVLIRGLWFRDYGFSPGDQVVISNPEPHALLMKLHKTAAEMDKERKEKDQKIDAYIRSL